MTDVSITWKLSHAQMETCKSVALVLGPDAADKMAAHFVTTQESLLATLAADDRPRGFTTIEKMPIDGMVAKSAMAMADRPAVYWPTF